MSLSSVPASAHAASRRSFLALAPAAAAGIALADTLAGPAAAAQAPQSSFQLFNAAAIQSDIAALKSNPGNNALVTNKNFLVALTVENAKTPAEFEWHEGRDHILQILEGSTVLDVGGTPKGGHSKAPGEWNAPESVGSTAYTLNKGDMLVIPRNTPHKRTTASYVALLLVSPE
jgi:mannose-6-phosphate isomerase-like protein (cupin superfamily)